MGQSSVASLHLCLVACFSQTHIKRALTKSILRLPLSHAGEGRDGFCVHPSVVVGFVFILRSWWVLCSSFGPGGFCVHPSVLAGFVVILRSWWVLCSSFGPGGFCVHLSVLVGFVVILRSWWVLCSSFGPGGFCVYLSTALSHDG